MADIFWWVAERIFMELKIAIFSNKRRGMCVIAERIIPFAHKTKCISFKLEWTRVSSILQLYFFNKSKRKYNLKIIYEKFK